MSQYGVPVNEKPIIGDSSSGKDQDFGGKTFGRNPRENEEAVVPSHEMEVSLLGGLAPADEGIGGFDSPCTRSPSEECYGSIFYKSHVLEVNLYNLPIRHAMMVLKQAVLEGLKRGMADQREGIGWEFAECSLNRALINLNYRNS